MLQWSAATPGIATADQARASALKVLSAWLATALNARLSAMDMGIARRLSRWLTTSAPTLTPALRVMAMAQYTRTGTRTRCSVVSVTQDGRALRARSSFALKAMILRRQDKLIVRLS